MPLSTVVGTTTSGAEPAMVKIGELCKASPSAIISSVITSPVVARSELYVLLDEIVTADNVGAVLSKVTFSPDNFASAVSPELPA